jgi:hypothetical protein
MRVNTGFGDILPCCSAMPACRRPVIRTPPADAALFASRLETGGRRPMLVPRQRTEILDMLAAGRSGADVARIFRVHRATIGRIAAEARATPDPEPVPVL